MTQDTFKYFKPEASNLRSDYGGDAILVNGDSAELSPLDLTTRHIARSLGIPSQGTHWLFQAGKDNVDDVWIRVPDNVYTAISSYLSASEIASVESDEADLPGGSFITQSTQPKLMPRANLITHISITNSLGVGTSGGGLTFAFLKQAVDQIQTTSDKGGGAVDREWENDTHCALLAGGDASSWGNDNAAGGIAVYPNRFDLSFNQRYRTLAISSSEPIYVVFHLDSNDIAYDSSLSTEDVLNRVLTQMTRFRTEFPDVICIASTVMGRGTSDPSTSGSLNHRINEYNEALELSYNSLGFNALYRPHLAHAALHPVTGAFSPTRDRTVYASDDVHLLGVGYGYMGTRYRTEIIQGTIPHSSYTLDYGGEPAAVPDTIDDLSSTVGDTEVDLLWTAPGANGATITDYTVEYKLSASDTWLTFSDGVSAIVGATVTGLTNDVSYDFRVAATNSVGTGIVSSTLTATPTATVAVSPTDLDNLVFLFDPSSTDNLTISDTDKVDQLDDLSGNGYHAVESGSTRPVLEVESGAGVQALKFDNANSTNMGLDLLMVNTMAMGNNTCIICYRTDDITRMQGLISSSRFHMHADYDGTSAVRYESGGEETHSVTKDTNWHIMVGRREGTSLRVGIDGASTSNTNGSTDVSTGNVLLGRLYSGGSTSLTGHLYKMFGTSDAMTLAEINDQCNALATELGTTWTDWT